MDYRDALPTDLGAVAAVWRESGLAVDGAPSEGHPTLAQNRARLDAEIAAGWRVRVALHEGRIVAFLAWDPGLSLLAQLFVLPAFHGRGIGRALLDHAKAAMPGGFTLRTAPGNLRARRFYVHSGLTLVSEGVHPKYGNPVCIYGWAASNRESRSTARQPDILLYRAIASRSFTALWMLEELGIGYRSVILDLSRGEHKAADFLKINPMGQVPALVVDGVAVTENPALCIFLADRFAYGTLAPRLDHPDRAAWLKWMVFATAVLEPARALGEVGAPPPGGWGGGWGSLAQVTAVLADAVRDRNFLLGDRFSAADVMLGSTISVSLFTGALTADPALTAYNDRLAARPAYRRALALNWPPDRFPPADQLG